MWQFANAQRVIPKVLSRVSANFVAHGKHYANKVGKWERFPLRTEQIIYTETKPYLRDYPEEERHVV